jgi:hypothetical protein
MAEAKRKVGFCWHLHHDELMEWCWDYDERVAFIREMKPKEEIPTRLRLFQPVKGKLPTEVIRTGGAYEKAWEAYKKAWAVYGEACVTHKTEEAFAKAEQAYAKAYVTYGKAGGDFREAYEKALKKHQKEIEVLHKKECPDCPWDGKTIFPLREGKP